MAIGKIEYNVKQPWNLTQNNEVGPTKDVNYRPESSLINPASNIITKDNIDTIYLDPINGVDTNTGLTLALAVRTFPEAVDKITSTGRTYIHIDTNAQSLKSTFTGAGFNATHPNPNGIAIKADGTLWVTSSKLIPLETEVNNVSLTGTLITKFTLVGIIDPLNLSGGVAVDPSGNLYVTEFGTGTSKIYLVSDTGTLIDSFNTSIFGPGTEQINGIAYDKSNDSLWCVDVFNFVIYNIETDGTFKDSFNVAAYGGGPPATGIGVSSDNKLWITENSTGKMYKIEKDGTLIQGFFTTPTPNAFSVTDPGDGTIWVTDNNTDTVSNLYMSTAEDLIVECDLGGLPVDLTGTAIKAQVTPGKTASVTFDGAYYWTGTGGQTNQFHGLYIDALNPKTSFNIITSPSPLIDFDIYPPFGVDIDNITGSISWEFDWCDLEMLSFYCQGTPTANNTYFRRVGGVDSTSSRNVFFRTVAAGIFNRNIFISADTTAHWFIMASSSATVTLTFNTFQTGFAVFVSDANNTGVVTIHSNIINGFTKFNNVEGTAGGAFHPIIEFSLLNLTTTDPNIDTTSNNNIFNKLPLFRQQGIDFRLQKKGYSPDGLLPEYQFNSPAIETGSGGIDMGAFDFTYVKGIESYDDLKMGMTIDNCDQQAYEKVKVNPERVNYQSWKDVKGRYKNTFDAICIGIHFETNKKEFMGSDWTQRFNNLFSIKGIKRYFPEGEPGIGLGIGINSGSDPYEITVTDRDGRRADVDGWFNNWAMRISQPVLSFADTDTQSIYTTELDGTLLTTDLYTIFEGVSTLNITGISESPLRESRTLYLVDDANGDGFIYHINFPAMTLIAKTSISGINSNWSAPGGIHADYNGLWLTVLDSSFGERVIVRLSLDYTHTSELMDDESFGTSGANTLTKDIKGKLWVVNVAEKDALFYNFESREIEKTAALTGIVPADIAVSAGNVMWIIEPSTNTVHKLDKDGGAISTFLTTSFDVLAIDTTAMCIIENKVTTALITAQAGDVYNTRYLTGEELTFPVKADTDIYISHLPSQLDMGKYDAVSEYYVDGNRTPWSKDNTDTESEEYHLRKWNLKQGLEKAFE